MKPFWVLFDFLNPEIQINLQGDEDPILVPSAKPQKQIQYWVLAAIFLELLMALMNIYHQLFHPICMSTMDLHQTMAL